MPERADRRRRASPIVSAAAVLAGSVVAVGALLCVRPHLSGDPSSWRSDDLAFAATWLVAIACAAWLGLTTLACVAALARGRQGRAARLARFAPPFARRIVQAALVTSFVLAPSAVGADTAPASFTLHVGADGRLTTAPEARPAGSGRSSDVPVVRTPPTTPTTTPPPTTPPPTPPTLITTPSASIASVPPVPPARHRSYVVRAGDNLWAIAKNEVARRGGATATDGQIARYWEDVVAANRATLRSGDPSLIFPGEVVALPLD